jgi:hypothetical protein
VSVRGRSPVRFPPVSQDVAAPDSDTVRGGDRSHSKTDRDSERTSSSKHHHKHSHEHSGEHGHRSRHSDHSSDRRAASDKAKSDRPKPR